MPKFMPARDAVPRGVRMIQQEARRLVNWYPQPDMPKEIQRQFARDFVKSRSKSNLPREIQRFNNRIIWEARARKIMSLE